MTLNHTDLIDRIQTILESTERFVQVFPGEPLGLPQGGPYAAFWYLGREVSIGSLRGQIDVTERYQVTCWWPRQAERTTLEPFENQIADTDQALHVAFRADSSLNAASATATSTFAVVTNSAVSYGVFPGSNLIYRALEFELHVNDREGESITK